MQTFFPIGNKTLEFNNACAASMSRLHYRHLGKQRVEVKQILNALRGKTKSWRNHPATLMWNGYEQRLLAYGIICCTEWIQRGYKDSLREEFSEQYKQLPAQPDPWWYGIKEFHAAHRSNLLRKKPNFYSKWNWKEPHNLPYWWPTKHVQART